jgi:hypothetical protein
MGAAINPLSTAKNPPRDGTKISSVTLANRKSLRLASSNVPTASMTIPEALSEPNSSRASEDNYGYIGSEGSVATDGPEGIPPVTTIPTNATTATSATAATTLQAVFGEALEREQTSNKKRRKPKNNIVKSNSSFVSRTVVHDGLSKRLSDRGENDLLAFVNIKRSFHWLNLNASTKVCLEMYYLNWL